MNDYLNFPALETFKELERILYPGRRRSPDSLTGFGESINIAFDRLGFSEEFVKRRIVERRRLNLTREQIEQHAFLPTKVIKDIIWGMINVDDTTVAVLDTPILQRLRNIRQNGFTYLVFPSASHHRLEHSLGVLAAASKYIDSINARVSHSQRFTEGLTPKSISRGMALDLKHAALLHDIGHFPFSHVLESIFEASADTFSIGSVSVRDFEIAYMKKFIDTKSRLSEKLSVALILSPRFRR
ncbi:MAG: HD domain-containing protein, partial [Hyphomicrobiales bacterium]